MGQTNMTGYPSVDRPWLKYYSQDIICADLPEGSMFHYLYSCNHDFPNQIAIQYYGTTITYRQLFQKIDQAAASFQKLGVRENDTVLFFTLSTPEVIYSLYGLNKMNVRCNLVNILSTPAEIHEYMIESKCTVVVCLGLFSQKVADALLGTQVKAVVAISPDNSMPAARRIGYALKHTTRNYPKGNRIFLTWRQFTDGNAGDSVGDIGTSSGIALVAHTGGTTGFPKSVLLTNQSMNAIAMQYLKAYPHERQQTALDLIVPQSVYGISINIHVPLCLGLGLAIIPKFAAEDWPKYIKWYKPKHIAAAPGHIIAFLKHPSLDMSSFTTIAFGGAGMDADMEGKINRYLQDHGFPSGLTKGYGMTETGGAAFITYHAHNKLLSVGIPLPKNNVMIWNSEKNEECTYNEIGEICVQGPALMQGYENNIQATTEILRHHIGKGVWLHTGDLGYVDTDGFLFIDGRIKRIIYTYMNGTGGKIFPERIERLLLKNPAVKYACVISKPDRERVSVASAYLVLEQGYTDQKETVKRQLIELCSEELAEYSRPVQYEFRSSLPLTPVGKVDYRALEQATQKENIRI